MATFCYEFKTGGSIKKCRADDADGAFRAVINKHWGKSYGWHPEGRFDPEPDTQGRIWYRGYVTKWSPRANARSIESSLLTIKIWPAA